MQASVRVRQEGGALEVVATAVRGLAEEAGTTSGTIDKCLDGIREAVRMLDAAAAEAGKLLRHVAAQGRPADAAGARQMAAVYTMQSERAVHREIFDSTPEDQESETGEAHRGATPEDNVEFF